VAATVVQRREPIAAGVGNAFRSFGSWWNDSHVGTPLKVALLLGVGIALVFNANWLVPLAMIAGILYVVYYGIWTMVAAWSAPEDAALSTGNATSPRANHFRRGRWQDYAREMLHRRAPAEKFAELTGSLLMAAFSSIVLAIVMLVIGSKDFSGSVDTYAFFAWFATTCTLGAWLVLVAGKLMESRGGEPVRRRFAMLVMGLTLGAAAFGVQQVLYINPQNVMDLPQVTDGAKSAGAYSSAMLPLLPAYLAYFAGIFVVLRWWKQVDPLRSTRLCIWTTGLCVLWAAVLEMFWHFPQPWGLMLVASISIAAQLSAPWINTAQRAKLKVEATRFPATGH
jgi:arginine exporter protein ArgO